jgi:phosphoserine phosphatase
MTRAILVDFDGTLTRVDTTRALVLSLLRFRPWLIFNAIYGYLRLSLSNGDQQIQFWKNWCVGKLIKGLSKDHLKAPLKVYAKQVAPLIRQDLMSYLRERQASGDRVLIVTASFENAVAYVLKEQGFLTLGAKFSEKHGVFEDKTLKPECFAEGKVIRILDWAKNIKEEMLFVEAWSDSLLDVPMMNLANKKVWVCKEAKNIFFSSVFSGARFWNVD